MIWFLFSIIYSKNFLDFEKYIYEKQLNKIENIVSYSKAKNEIYNIIIEMSPGEIERYIQYENKNQTYQLKKLKKKIEHFKQAMQNLDLKSYKTKLIMYNDLKLLKFKIKKLKINILYNKILINHLSQKLKNKKIKRIVGFEKLGVDISYLKNNNYEIINNIETNLYELSKKLNFSHKL